MGWLDCGGAAGEAEQGLRLLGSRLRPRTDLGGVGPCTL